MTFSFLWFAVGLIVGLEIACVLAWWSLRRKNRRQGVLTKRQAERVDDRAHVEALGRWRVDLGDDGAEPLASRRADP